MNVPIVGNITAGIPILAVENIEDTFPIPVDYIHNDTVFMLRVKGESMIEAGIFDKDLILVRQQQDANNGDIVVALIEDFATVKTFYKEKDFIRLQPENSLYVTHYRKGRCHFGQGHRSVQKILRRDESMYGYVKVGSAVPKLRVADCVYNKEEILKLVEAAAAKQVRVLSFPELFRYRLYLCGFVLSNTASARRRAGNSGDLQKQQKH